MNNIPVKCTSCPHSLVIDDPDPNDWFCDDDKALVCTKMANKNIKPDSKWASDRSKYRIIACSERPYNLAKAANIPYWCPLRMVTE